MCYFCAYFSVISMNVTNVTNDMLICMQTCKDMYIYNNEVYTYRNWMVYKTCVCVFSALWGLAQSQGVVLWLETNFTICLIKQIK